MDKSMKEAGRLKKKIQDMPIKRAMVLFVVGALLLAAIASVITIVSTYSVREAQFDLGNYDTVDAINSVLFLMIFVYVITCIIAAVYLLYNIKLCQPIKQLLAGTGQIAQNNLDFTMNYKSKDELGQVCASFEKMKIELRQSNAKMWQAAEERKKLNAVFAHDLRTPLTVLKGYTDFLEEYIPSKQMQPDKLVETTSKMAQHIERIEHYVKMMSVIQRVEDTPISPKQTTGKEVCDLLQGTVDNFKGQTGAALSFEMKQYEEILNIDRETVQRVLENLLSNGIRYAKNYIAVAASLEGDYFVLSVTDDGEGFPLVYMNAPFTPFYQENKPDHFGLGLNICRTLCRNHGGTIKISNAENGGAKVVTTFKIR